VHVSARLCAHVCVFACGMHLCIVLRLLLQIPLITCLVQQFDTFFLSNQFVCVQMHLHMWVHVCLCPRLCAFAMRHAFFNGRPLALTNTFDHMFGATVWRNQCVEATCVCAHAFMSAYIPRGELH
jgi:hypothetical protein